MTAANDALQNNASLASAADTINWKVVPATAIAAGIFFGLSQINEPIATGLAWLTFLTAFIGGDKYLGLRKPGQTAPLGTLLKVTGYGSGTKTDRGIPVQ